MELFTGANCPPCVAADLAFDGLQKAYSDKEVVLLQYHMNIPRGPEALTNADSDARFEYYADNYRKQVARHADDCVQRQAGSLRWRPGL